jgi:hypothetical protein
MVFVQLVDARRAMNVNQLHEHHPTTGERGDPQTQTRP